MDIRKSLVMTTLPLMVVVSACGSTASTDTTAGSAATTLESTSQTSTDTSSETVEVSDSGESTDTADTGEGVITDMTANGTGGGSPFDGSVDEASDLDDLVETAWGDGALDLHRGHAPIENVLVAFLGISHEEVHVYMDEQGMNLAAVAEELGLDPENLIESLTNSFVPFIEQGVENGVITEDEVATWTEQVREQFGNRVHWEG